MRYNIICVNYNGSDFCKDLCTSLESLEVPNNSRVRLVIVDNASEKEDCQNLYTVNSTNIEVEYIFLSENIGYFPAMNKGITFCRTSNHEHIIIGNNDLKYDSKFLINLNNMKIADNVMVVSPDVITIDGVHQNPLSVSKLTKRQLYLEDLYYSHYYISRFLINIKRTFKILLPNNKNHLDVNRYISKPMIIERGIGACYYLTNAFFDNYTRLDDRVFMWGEEALLSNQVVKAEGVILYEPSLVVEHYESGTVKKMLSRDKYEIVRRSYRIYRDYL